MGRRLNIEVDIRSRPGVPLVFKAISALKEWIEDEKEFWAVFPDDVPHSQAGQQTIRKMRGCFNTIETSLAGYEDSDKSEQALVELESALKTHLESSYNSNVPYSLLMTDKRSVYIAQVAGKEKHIGLVLLGIFSGEPNARSLNVHHTPAETTQRALLAEAAYDFVLPNMPQVEAAQIQSLQKEQRSFLAGKNEIESDLDGIHSNYSKQIEDDSEKFERALNDANNGLNAIKEEYEKYVRLSSPGSYWNQKRKSHRNWSITFGAGFSILLVGILTVSYVWGLPALSDLVKSVSVTLKDGSISLNTPRFIAMMATASFVVGLLLWPLRILLRFSISHAHLAADAAEKRTMLITYRSLSRSEDGLGEGEKELILDRIFQIAPSGLIKEGDGMPNTPINVIAKMIGNRS